MSGYATLLFLHVTGAILIFAGIAALIFGVAAMRLASTVDQVRAIARPMLVGRKIGLEHISVVDVLTLIGIVLTAGTGLYMATNWGFGRGWVVAAIASFALMAPIGPFVINPRLQAIGKAAEAAMPGPLDKDLLARTHDPLITGELLTLTAWLLGIVFLMTTKPSLPAAVAAMSGALLLGLAASLSIWRIGNAGRGQLSPDAHRAKRP